MANNVGRPKGLPKSPNSGRKKGTRNSKPATPEAVREEVRGHILESYTAMGGVEWLKQVARDHPLAFLSQCWSRIAPPIPRPEETVPATVVNVHSLPVLEQAKYVAFLLAQGAQELDPPPPRTIEHVPPPPPLDFPDKMPEPAVDIEAIKSRELVADTHERTIENYFGSAAEQGIKRRRTPN